MRPSSRERGSGVIAPLVRACAPVLAAALSALMTVRRAAVLVLAGVLLVGVAAAEPAPDPAPDPAPNPAVERRVPETRADVLLSYAPVVRVAAPAVVNIYSRRVVQSRPPTPMFDDPFFRRFFGPDWPFGAPRARVQNALGSGVIVDAGGIVVTNRHVIAEATEITVVLADRREFDVEVIGADDATDLAVLRIDVGDEALPALRLRDSDTVEVGDIVLAIGNPFGVGQTVTSGIVSAIARTRVGLGDHDFFIQTDAAINPGNSGGALVDMTGALIGINTAIYSRSGASHGIGFAVPANLVRSVVAGITGEGRLVRPWLGARTRAVSADLAAGLGLTRPRGVIVEELHPRGPAAAAGLDTGDVLLTIDGHAVDTPQALDYRLATGSIGETVEVRRWRRGREETVRLRLVEALEDPPRDLTELSGAHPLAGATVANMSPALAQELGVSAFRDGVIVVAVRPGSAADRFGVRSGDVVVSVNGNDITTAAGLKARLARSEPVQRMRLRRGDQVLEWRMSG